MQRRRLSDRGFFWAMVALTTVLVAVPVIFSMWLTPPGQVFTGTSVYSPIDLPVYFADIQQVAQGHLLVHDLFTTEGPQHGMFHILWVALGGLARLFQLEPWVVFHGARILLAPCLVWVLWWAGKRWLPQQMWRFGLFMSIFGSGTGVLLNQWLQGHDLAHIGLDQWVPEGFVFMSMLQSPHYVLALALFTLVLACWFQATRFNTVRRWRWVLLSGLLASVLFSFHPFHIFTIGLIQVTHATTLIILDHRRYRFLWWLVPTWFLCALPGASYQIWLQWGDPVLRARSFQSKTSTPSLATVYLSLTVLWVFALIGIRRLWKEQRESAIFLLIWGVVQTLALFAPIQVNRRFIMGLQIDLSVAATAGWWYVFRDWSWSRYKTALWFWQQPLGAVVVMLVFGFSSFGAYVNFLRAPSAIPDLLYMSQAQKNAYAWIKKNTAESASVLALSWPATLLPGETGRATYVGHHHETIDWEHKLETARTIYFSTHSQTTTNELKKIGVSYVLVQPTLQFTPPAASHVMFEEDEWRVFELDF